MLNDMAVQSESDVYLATDEDDSEIDFGNLPPTYVRVEIQVDLLK